MKRREFLSDAFAAAALGAAAPVSVRAETFKTTLKKALLADVADEATCVRIAGAGFPGVELMKKDVSFDQAKAGRACADAHGLKIHSFMAGWANFNAKDPEARKASVEAVKRNLRLAGIYGAETILLVPARVNAPKIKAADFAIDFEPGTLRVTRVVKGNNAPYADYIAVQNDATERCREGVEALLPVAKQEGVKIALENVWNNLWVLPDFAAAYIRSFNDPWVRAYFDIGNHVKYAPPEEWLRKLGSLIVKLHIKDFKIDRAKPNEGTFVPIGKGSIDWVSVRHTIDEIGYSGWVSIESDGYTDAEHSRLMDRFFAGQGAKI